MVKYTAKSVHFLINQCSAFEKQCDWDNSGFLIGDPDSVTKKVGFTLDLTNATLKKAIENGVDLIVTHHPVIFQPKKELLKGDIAYEAAKAGINVISAHTNYDNCRKGVSYALAEKIGLKVTITNLDKELPECLSGGTCDEQEPRKFAEKVAEALSTTVRFSDGKKPIKKVLVCGGSGGDFISDALNFGADAYITGDLSHHHFLMAEQCGITLIAAGHYETETPGVMKLMKLISDCFPGLECIYLDQENPVEFIGTK